MTTFLSDVPRGTIYSKTITLDSAMTRKDKLKLLKEWQLHLLNVDAMVDSGEKFINLHGDWADAFWRQQSFSTRIVAQLVGDTTGACEWFHLERDLGRNPMKWKTKGGRFRTAKNIEGLLKCIEASA